MYSVRQLLKCIFCSKKRQSDLIQSQLRTKAQIRILNSFVLQQKDEESGGESPNFEADSDGSSADELEIDQAQEEEKKGEQNKEDLMQSSHRSFGEVRNIVRMGSNEVFYVAGNPFIGPQDPEEPEETPQKAAEKHIEQEPPGQEQEPQQEPQQEEVKNELNDIIVAQQIEQPPQLAIPINEPRILEADDGDNESSSDEEHERELEEITEEQEQLEID